MSIMTTAARLTHHSDRPPASASNTAAETEPRPHGGAARTSLVHHWPLLFILVGAVAMIGWIGAILWAAVWLLSWMVG